MGNSRPFRPRFHGPWNEIDAAIRARYPQEGGAGIAQHFGLSKASISMRAWRIGVACKTHYQRKAATRSERNTSVNQAYFDEWSPSMAWLLGYIWTDGAVSAKDGRNFKVTFRCKVDDEHVIHDIKREMGLRYNLEYFPCRVAHINGRRTLSKPQVGISLSCKRIVQQLISRFGILPNKSHLDLPMPPVPDQHLSHFVRGVLDGDGTIAKNGHSPHLVGFYGTRRFIEQLAARLIAILGLRKVKVHPHTQTPSLFVVAWTSRRDVKALLEWLYPPGEYLHLRRKRVIAERFLRMIAITLESRDNG